MGYVSDEILMHYGVSKRDGAPVGSGRYPLGSGENRYQRPADFLDRVERYKSKGFSEKKIAEELGLRSTTELRFQQKIAIAERRSKDVAIAEELRDQGLNPYEIGREMGKNESTVRSLLNPQTKANRSQMFTTADFLENLVEEKGMIDVTPGSTEIQLGVSKETLNSALYLLQDRGYPVYKNRLPQVTNKTQFTTQSVLCPKGTPYSDSYKFDQIHMVDEGSQILREGGTKIEPAFQYPASMDSKRLAIRYAEEGGIKKDGVIEIRPGVKDLSLGDSHYAQVRILVDGTHYLKGMAIYSNDLPKGVDVLFNTNKKQGTPALGEDKKNSVLKPISKKDPTNPFGSSLKMNGGQSNYIGEDGEEHLSLINKTREEGDWNDWSDKVSSQFLAKQPVPTIKKQLNLTLQDAESELREIQILTNPTVRKKLLLDYADQLDKMAVDLKASPFPGQKYKVILPLTTIKDTEVYAPSYENGEEVALIRYPHGGRFEIPILKVNNKNPEGIELFGKNPIDCVGISAAVAERLSGADFDGDTVMVIPTKTTHVASAPPLKGLKGFEPKAEYRGEGDFKRMSNTQNEMGQVSNLITDMTLKGAKPEEIEMAVRHSMVVIDAEKHGLDYKRSEYDNKIKQLKKEYMGHYTPDGKFSTGASTLISAASSEVRIPQTQGSAKINQKGKYWYDPNLPEGALIWKLADDPTYIDKNGKERPRLKNSTRMAETNDAFTLVSEARTAPEIEYAMFANTLKQMALDTRKEAVYTEPIHRSSSAAIVYAKEVDALNAKLNLSKLNKPLEREAQRRAGAKLALIRQSMKDAGASDSEIKKEIDDSRQRVLAEKRAEVGAKHYPFEITEKEWEAIQNGAISDSKLNEILLYANPDRVRELALPRTMTTLTDAKQARIKNLLASGYSTSEIANAVGVSVSTINRFVADPNSFSKGSES